MFFGCIFLFSFWNRDLDVGPALATERLVAIWLVSAFWAVHDFCLEFV